MCVSVCVRAPSVCPCAHVSCSCQLGLSMDPAVGACAQNRSARVKSSKSGTTAYFARLSFCLQPCHAAREANISGLFQGAPEGPQPRSLDHVPKDASKFRSGQRHPGYVPSRTRPSLGRTPGLGRFAAHSVCALGSIFG